MLTCGTSGHAAPVPRGGVYICFRLAESRGWRARWGHQHGTPPTGWKGVDNSDTQCENFDREYPRMESFFSLLMSINVLVMYATMCMFKEMRVSTEY